MKALEALQLEEEKKKLNEAGDTSERQIADDVEMISTPDANLKKKETDKEKDTKKAQPKTETTTEETVSSIAPPLPSPVKDTSELSSSETPFVLHPPDKERIAPSPHSQHSCILL